MEIGYSAMFVILGGFVSVALWVGFALILKPACAPRDGFEERRVTNALAAAQ